MMNNYLLFYGHQHYPEGGFLDLKYQSSFQDCKKEFESLTGDEWYDQWAHIVSLETLSIVLYGLKENTEVECLWATSKEELHKLYRERWDQLHPKQELKPIDLSKVKFYED